MKMRAIIPVAVLLLILLASAALVQADVRQPAGALTAQAGVASGGGYRLTSLVWQASGTASGGDYRLLTVSRPRLTGNGCCCIYLPCLQR
jgi:hypothetical protein